jgi:hypothetical protein
LIEALTKAIITARRSPRNETELDIELLDDLVGQYSQLDLVPALEAHCENCGDYLIRCPLCQSPYEPVEQNQQIVFLCPNHQDQILQDNQTIQSECAAELEVTFSSDLRLFPGADILKTLHDFLASMENQGYDGARQATGRSSDHQGNPGRLESERGLRGCDIWTARLSLFLKRCS